MKNALLISLLIVTAVSVPVMGGWFYAAQDDLNRLFENDAYGYWKAAHNLAEYGIFSESARKPIVPISFRTPAFPAFLAPFTLLEGFSLKHAVIIQMILLLGVGWLATILAYRLEGGRQTAAIAGIAASLHPLLLFESIRVMSEILFAFVLTGSFLCWALWRSKPENRFWMLVAHLGFGILPLVKPVAFYLLVIPLAYTARCYLADRETSPVRGVRTSYVLAILLLLLPAGAWMGRNAAVFGNFYFSENGAGNLRLTHANLVLAEAEGKSYERLYNREFPLMFRRVYEPESSPAEAAKQWRQEALEIFARHPMTTIEVTAGNVWRLVEPSTKRTAEVLGLEYSGLNGAWTSAREFAYFETKDRLRAMAGDEWLTFFLSVFERLALLIAVVLAFRTVYTLGADFFSVFWLVLVYTGGIVFLSLFTGKMASGRFLAPCLPALFAVAAFSLKREKSETTE